MPNSKKAKEQRRNALAKARAKNPKNQGLSSKEPIPLFSNKGSKL